jgi:hypothetical protein
MRITDDPYSRERLCLDLALRLLLHEARTQTIRMWTGLTDDRIRKLSCSSCTLLNNNPDRCGNASIQRYPLVQLLH